MSEKETMIRLEGIKKRFRTKAGELEVLHGVSEDIKKELRAITPHTYTGL